MDNARAALIIAALFVVLLSAFGVGHYQPCTGQKPCAGRMPASLLPGARFGPAQPEARAEKPPDGPQGVRQENGQDTNQNFGQDIGREALADSAARRSVQDR